MFGLFGKRHERKCADLYCDRFECKPIEEMLEISRIKFREIFEQPIPTWEELNHKPELVDKPIEPPLMNGLKVKNETGEPIFITMKENAVTIQFDSSIINKVIVIQKTK